MEENKPKNSADKMEEALAQHGQERFVLRLYVAGTTAHSARAIANIKSICDEELEGRYELDVVDVYQQPAIVKDEQILALPMLVKRLPSPLRKMIGDLSDRDRVIVALDIRRAEGEG